MRQQYAAGPVPLHREMQQTLVNLRDKPPSFVGSREWIGSVELSLLLDHYYEARRFHIAPAFTRACMLIRSRFVRDEPCAGVVPNHPHELGRRVSVQGERDCTSL